VSEGLTAKSKPLSNSLRGVTRRLDWGGLSGTPGKGETSLAVAVWCLYGGDLGNDDSSQ
jgi:hypothetical protein